MSDIKTPEQIGLMAEAGKLLAACHKELRQFIGPGVSTLEVNQFVEEFLHRHGAKAEQKGYRGYPYATCAAVNEIVCHGFPNQVPLEDGDIVTIDMVVNCNGWLADSAWSYEVGTVSEEAKRLLRVTKECLYLGIEKAVEGNRIGDISSVIQKHAEKAGYSVVRDFCGHGIGAVIHEGVEVPHFGLPGMGPILREGMVITIEPMLNMGSYPVRIDADGWTVRTADGSLSAQYEHTIAITKEEPWVLTEQD